MEIRAYIGVIGSGKDYTAEKECNVKLGFADKLREDVWKLLNWAPDNEEEYLAFKENTFDVDAYELRYLELKGRVLMCNYADVIKQTYPNYFTEHLLKKLKVLIQESPNIIIGITDCRFPEEVKALLQFGKENNIKVTFVHCDFRSERYNNYSEHNSEKMAQQFTSLKYTEDEFNNVIKNLYK